MLRSTEIHQDCDELCHTERKQDTWLKEQKELKSVLNFSQLKPSGMPFFCLFSFFLLLPLLLILPFSNFSFFTHFFMFFLFFPFPFLHLEGSLLQPGLSRTSSPRSALYPYHFHSFSSQPSLHTDPRPKHEPSLIPNFALRALAPTLSWPHSRIQTPDAALGTGSSASTCYSLPHHLRFTFLFSLLYRLRLWAGSRRRNVVIGSHLNDSLYQAAPGPTSSPRPTPCLCHSYMFSLLILLPYIEP